MHVAVFGAGSVGCYYGGMLARAGHPVTLIGRAHHVQAVNRDGLRLQATTFDEYVPLHASVEASAAASADLVLCCVKSGQTNDAGHLLAPHLKPDTLVLSLQNGVGNAQRLTEILAREVIPAVVYVATEMAGDGHVRHHGRGELVLGPGVKSQTVADTLTEAAIPTTVSPEVEQALWTKLVLNCVYNPLSALTDMPYGEMVQQPHVTDVMRALYDESVAVAKAEGVELAADLWETVSGLAHAMAHQRSSTAQDLRRGKPTEIDYINGEIMQRGSRHGLPTPLNQAMVALVHAASARAKA
jgi:2-dehydropantoate 2-reductase